MTGAHWLYSHAHQEPGTDAVSEHQPYENTVNTVLSFFLKKKKKNRKDSVPINALEQ